MSRFWIQHSRTHWVEIAIGIALIHSSSFAQDGMHKGDFIVCPDSGKAIEELIAKSSMQDTPTFQTLKDHLDTYTINFDNISIIEYIRFTSKITNLNFVFTEQDLQFTVSVISEEPVTPANILSMLIQILRMNGLVVLEQDNNLLITKVRNVTQLATVVAGDVPSPLQASPLVTRVFRIKNGNLITLATIIKPMLSDSALLEVSAETRQLIVTDITTNVDKIATLLLALDAPHSSLVMEPYVARHISLDMLIPLVKEIIAPFSEGNPITFVPQVDTNTIFIVSTPYLVERAVTILNDVDVPSKYGKEVAQYDQEVFLYPLGAKKEHQVLALIEALRHELQHRGASHKISNCLSGAQWIQESNAILFIGDQETLGKVREMLPATETAQMGMKGAEFLIYTPLHAQGAKIASALHTLSKNLHAAGLRDPDLFNALEGMRYVDATNLLLFAGTPPALERVKELLQNVDSLRFNQHHIQQLGETTFLIYKVQYIPASQLISSLKTVAKDLEKTGAIDPLVIGAIQRLKWVQETDSLLITGSEETLHQVEELLHKFDTQPQTASGDTTSSSSTFIVYTPQNQSGEVLLEILHDFQQRLLKSGVHNAPLFDTIAHLQYLPRTSSLIVSGTPESITKVEELLHRFDIPSTLNSSVSSIGNSRHFVVYNPKYQSGEELIGMLKEFEHNLDLAGITDGALFDVIDHLKYIARTHSLILSGDPTSVARVEELLHRFDVSESCQPLSSIESIQDTSFFIYKLQYHQGDEILNALQQIVKGLSSESAGNNPALLNAVHSIQWVRVTNSLVASGQPDTLVKLRELVQNLDVPLRQVFIEVLVIETTVSNAQNFGLQWGSRMRYLNKWGGGIGNFPAPSLSPAAATNPLQAGPLATEGFTSRNSIVPGIHQPSDVPGSFGPGKIPFFSGFDFGVIGDIIMHKGKSFVSIGSLLSALQTDSDSTVVLNPKIITQDNKTSTIFVGQNVPFVGAQVETNSNIVSSTNNVQYRDIGFNLTITPTIGSNDVVSLDINTDISQVVSNPTLTLVSNTSSSGQITGIQTSHTSMATKVHVPDQHFVVLSGMISDQKFRAKSGLPCLGSLPLLGALFAEKDRSGSKQNLIFFIRPHIVNTYEEYRNITEQQEILYKEQAGSSTLREEFDAGVNLIKQPDD